VNPSLKGWLLRDALITLVVTTSLSQVHAWQLTSPSALLSASSGLIGFIFTYIVIYMAHEWGHWVGARSSRSAMPFAPYRSPLIGYFDTQKHTPTQFLFLSWGGVLAYLCASICAVLIFFVTPGAVTAGMAIAGLAFTVQSLSVDLPQIIKVHRNADPHATNQQGTVPNLILKRTWQTWLPLAAILLLWNLTA
jgi:hypothetical protein